MKLRSWDDIISWYATAEEHPHPLLAAAMIEHDGDLSAAWADLIDDLEAGAGDATYDGALPSLSELRASFVSWLHYHTDGAVVRVLSTYLGDDA